MHRVADPDPGTVSGKQRVGSKDRRDLVEWATGRGWSWRVTGSGHIRFDHPEASGAVFVPSSPRIKGGHLEKQKLARALRRPEEPCRN